MRRLNPSPQFTNSMNYYVRKTADSDVQGPFSVEKLKQLLAEGSLSSESLVTADLGEGLESVAKSPKRDWSQLICIEDVVGRPDNLCGKNQQAAEVDAEISLRRRIGLVITAWIATAVLTFPGIMHPPSLPAGLLVFVGMGEANPMTQPLLIIGWIVYITLTLSALLSRRKNTYSTIFTVLCVLLLLNSAGCRLMMAGFGDIH